MSKSRTSAKAKLSKVELDEMVGLLSQIGDEMQDILNRNNEDAEAEELVDVREAILQDVRKWQTTLRDIPNYVDRKALAASLNRCIMTHMHSIKAACYPALRHFQELDISQLASCMEGSSGLHYLCILPGAPEAAAMQLVMDALLSATDITESRAPSLKGIMAQAAWSVINASLHCCGLPEDHAVVKAADSRAAGMLRGWSQRCIMAEAAATLAVVPKAVHLMSAEKLKFVLTWCWVEGSVCAKDTALLRSAITTAVVEAVTNPTMTKAVASAVLIHIGLTAMAVTKTAIGPHASGLRFGAMAANGPVNQCSCTMFCLAALGNATTAADVCAFLANAKNVDDVAVVLAAFFIGSLGVDAMDPFPASTPSMGNNALGAIEALACGRPALLQRLLQRELGVLNVLMQLLFNAKKLSLLSVVYPNMKKVLARACEGVPGLHDLFTAVTCKLSPMEALQLMAQRPSAHIALWAAYTARAIAGKFAGDATPAEVQRLAPRLMEHAMYILGQSIANHTPYTSRFLADVTSILLRSTQEDQARTLVVCVLDYLAELDPVYIAQVASNYLGRSDVGDADRAAVLSAPALMKAGKHDPRGLCALLDTTVRGCSCKLLQGLSATICKLLLPRKARTHAITNSIYALGWVPELREALAPVMARKLLGTLAAGKEDSELLPLIERFFLLERTTGGEPLLWRHIASNPQQACKALGRMICSKDPACKAFGARAVSIMWSALGSAPVEALLRNGASKEMLHRMCEMGDAAMALYPESSIGRVLGVLARAACLERPRSACGGCGKPRAQIRAVSNRVYRCPCPLRPIYCGVACQRVHWRAGHNNMCLSAASCSGCM